MLFIALATCSGNVEIEDKQLGLLRAVPRANCANELGGRSADPPHDAAGPARGELDQVPDELAGADVPELDGAVVRRRDHKPVAGLQAGHCRLVLVRPCTQIRKSNLVILIEIINTHKKKMCNPAVLEPAPLLSRGQCFCPLIYASASIPHQINFSLPLGIHL